MNIGLPATAVQRGVKSCSKVLLPDKERKLYRLKAMNPALPYLSKKALRKQILDKSKKVNTCPYCREANGVVKKCGLLKIVHEKFRHKKSSDPIVMEKIGIFP
ncbi:unnamed protein product [Timema podura]|uniref:Uncharacterized protein n=1 Tax=Timema podura TaxID=61482 RepID=A0ABN7NKS6_TIMPD|nr:unnamed protein product [Timema podura]